MSSSNPRLRFERISKPLKGFDKTLAEECTVTIHRNNTKIKVTCMPRSRRHSDCILTFISWLAAAYNTIDIAIFTIFHKKIIKAIVKKQQKGVRCRIIVYRHFMEGEKKKKHRKYIKSLLKAGVQIHWATAKLVPDRIYRVVLIDCFKACEENEGVFVFGDQTIYTGPYTAIKDVLGCVIKADPPDDATSMITRFERMWRDENADHFELDSDNSEVVLIE